MATQTIYTNKDAHTFSNNPDSNDGAEHWVSIVYNISGIYATGFFGFDITSAPTANNTASTTLHICQRTDGLGSASNAYFERTTSVWTETGITWNNKPTTTITNRYTHLLPEKPAVLTWRSFDITNLYKDAKNAGNDFGISIRYYEGSQSTIWKSKEANSGIYKSYIEINTFGDYYVKTDGNDSGDGLSWANAWKTINKAAITVTDGNNVHIGFGTYDAEPAANKIAPQNIGTSGIYYLPETANTGGGTGTVSVEQNT